MGETAERGPGCPAHLANTATGGASGGATAALGTATAAGAAGFQVRNANLPLLSEHPLLKVDREVVAQVISLLRSTTALLTTTTGGSTEPAEEGFKNIGKATHVAHVGHASSATESRLTELVVATTGLGVTENLVGTTDLFEAILCARVFVDVGVILASQSPIGPFEGVGISIPTDTE